MSGFAIHQFSSLDGTIVETSVARLPAPGMDKPPERSVFTTVKIKNGRPVFFDDHLSRMLTSIRAFGIDAHVDRQHLSENCAALIAANQSTNCAMRIIFYAHEGKVHEVLQTRDRELDANKYADGFRLMTVRRDPNHGPASGRKTLDFRSNLDALASARENGCDEVLFFNSAGEAWECSVSNIFAVIDGIAVTPPATRGVLPGIIRDRLLRKTTGHSVREEPLPMNTLLGAEEVFVTNSLLGVMPVSVIDNQYFRRGESSVTSALQRNLEIWEREDLESISQKGDLT